MSDEITDVSTEDVATQGIENTEGEGATEDQNDVEDYTPNFTYKVKDQELEFDEELRPLINDPKIEERLRDLYTKAGGLDSYKEKLSEREKSIQDYEQRLSTLGQGFNSMKQYRDDGDYRRLFGSLGVNDEAILEYAVKLAQEAEMPEEQRQIVQANREYEDKLFEMQQKVQQYETKFKSVEQQQQEQVVREGMAQLDTMVQSNKDLNNFLTQNGIDLKQEVVQHGLTMFNATGRDPSLEEAFQAVANKYAKLLPSKEQQIEQIINNRPDTLPKIHGSNQTSSDEKITLDKLRQMSKSMSY